MTDHILEKIERKKEENKPFLIGEPISWASITEEDNKKEWLWENYIAKRHITLLSALWKAGKTTFLRCLFIAMAHEEEFGGQPTKKCKVLVISEEDKGEWADNKDILNDSDIKDILVWSRPIRIKPNIKQWTELCEQVSERCIKDKIDLVVIDTLTTFWPIDNENDSAQVIKALVPLYNFTEKNIAVLLVHHFRKGGGEQAQASRGSGALPGFVDNIIEFTRSDDGFPNYRQLRTYGRFDAVTPEVIIEYTEEGKYVTKGEPWQVSKSARLEKILNIFEDSVKSMSGREVFNVWSSTVRGMSLRSVQRYIKELLSFGYLVLDKEETVAGKIVPFYARNVSHKFAATTLTPLPLRPVAADMPTVAGGTQISLASRDTTGISVIPEDKDENPFE